MACVLVTRERSAVRAKDVRPQRATPQLFVLAEPSCVAAACRIELASGCKTLEIT